MAASLVAFLSVLTVAPSAATGMPEVAHLGPVAPDIVGITVKAARVEYGHQVPYQWQEGDETDSATHHRWVKRDGTFIGSLAGRERTILYTPDSLLGEPLSTEWAARPGNYLVTSPDDARYSDGVVPLAVPNGFVS